MIGLTLTMGAALSVPWDEWLESCEFEMPQFVEYFGQYRSVRGRFGGLPSWAKLLLSILALPGIVLIVLSIVALGVSILALLLLTVPVYRLLSAVTSSDQATVPETRTEFVPESFNDSPGRRHVDVKIIDPES